MNNRGRLAEAVRLRRVWRVLGAVWMFLGNLRGLAGTPRERRGREALAVFPGGRVAHGLKNPPTDDGRPTTARAARRAMCEKPAQLTSPTATAGLP